MLIIDAQDLSIMCRLFSAMFNLCLGRIDDYGDPSRGVRATRLCLYPERSPLPGTRFRQKSLSEG